MGFFSTSRFNDNRHPSFDKFPDGTLVKHKAGGPVMCVEDQREFGAVCSYWSIVHGAFGSSLFGYDCLTNLVSTGLQDGTA